MTGDEFELDARMHPRLRRVLQGMIALVALALLAGIGFHGWQWWETHQAGQREAGVRQAEQATLSASMHRQAPQLEARMQKLARQLDAMEQALAKAPAPTGTRQQAEETAAYRQEALGQFGNAAEVDRELSRLARQAARLTGGLGASRHPETMTLGAQLARLSTLRHQQAALNTRFANVQQELGTLEAERAAERRRIRMIADASHIDYAKGHPVGQHYYSPNGRIMYPRFNGTGAVPMYNPKTQEARSER